MPNAISLFDSYQKEWTFDENTLVICIDYKANKTHLSLQKDGCVQEIPLSDVEGIPREALTDTSKLAVFIDQAVIRLSPCSDGSYKVHANQRLLGGGNMEQNPSRLWLGAIIPYVIHDSMASKRSTIMAAMKAWEVAGFRFVERTNQNDYVEFTWDTSTSSCKVDAEHCSVCESSVGRQGGRQLVNCDLYTPGNFNLGSLTHEIGHVIGLYHEQQRSDRDTYVKVRDDMPLSDPNYGKVSADKRFGVYDFESIMHYHFFEVPTIEQSIRDRSGREVRQTFTDYAGRKMRIRGELPDPQYQQIVDLGSHQDTSVAGLDEMQRGTIDGPVADAIWNGVFEVGSQKKLSRGDIEAASELAKRGKNPDFVRDTAQTYADGGDASRAIEYSAMAYRCSLAVSTHDDASLTRLNSYLKYAQVTTTPAAAKRIINSALAHFCQDLPIGKSAPTTSLPSYRLAGPSSSMPSDTSASSSYSPYSYRGGRR